MNPLWEYNESEDYGDNSDINEADKDFNMTTCPFCEGQGMVQGTISIGGLGSIDGTFPCMICNGAGMVLKRDYEKIVKHIDEQNQE
jgi:DnaJ-class molecular chaperone